MIIVGALIFLGAVTGLLYKAKTEWCIKNKVNPGENTPVNTGRDKSKVLENTQSALKETNINETSKGNFSRNELGQMSGNVGGNLNVGDTHNKTVVEKQIVHNNYYIMPKDSNIPIEDKNMPVIPEMEPEPTNNMEPEPNNNME